MLLYEYMADMETKAYLDRVLDGVEEARLVNSCQKPSKSSAQKRSLRESLRTFLEWQGTLRVRLGPALDY